MRRGTSSNAKRWASSGKQGGEAEHDGESLSLELKRSQPDFERARAEMAERLTKALDEAGLAYEGLAYLPQRRGDWPELHHRRQADRSEELLGPRPDRLSWTKAPDESVIGFAKRNNVLVEALERRDATRRIPRLHRRNQGAIRGEDLLLTMLTQAVTNFTGPKRCAKHALR